MRILDKLISLGIGCIIFKTIRAISESAAEEKRRNNTVCTFSQGISENEFHEIAIQSTRKIKRIVSTDCEKTMVYCTVESQSGINNWKFSLDFNDYGRLTGTYWVSTENSDSAIPDSIGKRIKSSIENVLSN